MSPFMKYVRREIYGYREKINQRKPVTDQHVIT